MNLYRENKVKCMLVGKVAINVDEENIRTTYSFNFYEDFEGFRWEYENVPEDQIFKTKQELLNSL